MTKPQFKLSMIIMLLFTAAPVLAQGTVQSGTIILVFNDQARILVLADSREDNPADDKACKIVRLGDHAFYAATGRVYPDQAELIVDAFKSVPSHDVLVVGRQWAKTMTK
jgi:hypothetical protein